MIRTIVATLVLAGTVTLASVPRDAHTDMSPAVVVATLPECTATLDHDCYVIDAHGNVFVL